MSSDKAKDAEELADFTSFKAYGYAAFDEFFEGVVGVLSRGASYEAMDFDELIVALRNGDVPPPTEDDIAQLRHIVDRVSRSEEEVDQAIERMPHNVDDLLAIWNEYRSVRVVVSRLLVAIGEAKA